MKYIRTKNNVYEIMKECGACYITTTDEMPYKKDIIKEADTIEELCDEFRYEYDKFLKHERCWRSRKTGMWLDNDNDLPLSEKEISTIKGAIWTDKGLIYVAKMNEKGELELL